jgi:hypothetical protein
MTDCQECIESEFANTTGLSGCYACPLGSKNVAKGSDSLQDCLICSSGFYGKPLAGSPCRYCPIADGTSCPDNSSIPLVANGYFRSSDDFSVVYKCQPDKSCVYTGYREQTVCDVGYSGFVCGSCDFDYYKYNAECKRCPGSATKWLYITLAIVVVVFLLFRVSSQSREIPVDIRIVLQGIQQVALFPNITLKWPPFVLSCLQMFSLAVS